ncbi:hypothetical protein [Psychrobacillus soli]|uniref:Uncharacterized protein n=1 Tax=Psychrobacillus soli TaxID=1543965 RepID=A0A544T0I5_9BACI|nr:hypothetical protein [Psychrobacillus soli]TQR10956.1 hypothetical protein FG383_14640 [Psychrobacillus soli]
MSKYVSFPYLWKTYLFIIPLFLLFTCSNIEKYEHVEVHLVETVGENTSSYITNVGHGDDLKDVVQEPSTILIPMDKKDPFQLVDMT